MMSSLRKCSLTAALGAATLFLGAALTAPAPATAADIFVRGQIGNVHVGVKTGDFRRGHRHPGRKFGHRGEKFGHGRRHFDGFRHRPRKREPVLFGTGPVNDFARDQKKAAAEQRHRPRKRHSKRRFHQPYYGVPYVYDYGYDYYDGRDYVSPESAYPPPPFEPPQVREEPRTGTPPDFSSVAEPRFEAARGADLPAQSSRYSVGEPLPRGAPHVALDWRDYGLPRPPAGDMYVRFSGAVLQIDAASRVVRKIVSEG